MKSDRQAAYSVAKETEKFFINGYTVREFTNRNSQQDFTALLKQINENPKGGFTWEQKYRGSEDLQPNTYTYDAKFVDFLFEQNIPQLLRELTGFDLILGDVALRRATSSVRYMGWHRDTHFYTGQSTAGRMPPLIKMIMYPALGEAPRSELRVVPGSHRRVFRNKIVDRLQTATVKWDTIYSSDHSFFIFNSMLQHSVASNQKQARPSLRIFYNFCLESQLDQFPDRTGLHNTYRAKLSSANPMPQTTPAPETVAIPA